MSYYSSDVFMENLKKYGFLDGCYTIYGDSWPELKVQLTANQLKKIKSIDIQSRIIQCESMLSHTENLPNLCGSTKYRMDNDWLVIKGSESLIQTFIDSVF